MSISLILYRPRENERNIIVSFDRFIIYIYIIFFCPVGTSSKSVNAKQGAEIIVKKRSWRALKIK